jgi:8-oxo-dGTP pyrophosphatase MutT (NUDIX family)
MEWIVHGRRPVYESSWISMDLVDVELPDGQRFEQHVVRMARPVAGAAVLDEAGRVLLMWRHRHVTGSWGWEIPTGRIETEESPEQAAAREVEEETGWRPRSFEVGAGGAGGVVADDGDCAAGFAAAGGDFVDVGVGPGGGYRGCLLLGQLGFDLRGQFGADGGRVGENGERPDLAHDIGLTAG